MMEKSMCSKSVFQRQTISELLNSRFTDTNNTTSETNKNSSTAICRRTILNVREVSTYLNLSKPTIYRLMNEGKFPRPIQLSKNRVAWRSDEIEFWLETLPKSGGIKND